MLPDRYNPWAPSSGVELFGRVLTVAATVTVSLTASHITIGHVLAELVEEEMFGGEQTK